MKNKYAIALAFLTATLLGSCTSFGDTVKANKEKFIQVGIENSQPVDINNLEAMYARDQANNTEAKTKALNVKKLEVLYQDSVVLFINGSELAVYDFSGSEREMSSLSSKLKLSSIEKIDKRLFFGRR
jgi:hypothetical protein